MMPVIYGSIWLDDDSIQLDRGDIVWKLADANATGIPASPLLMPQRFSTSSVSADESARSHLPSPPPLFVSSVQVVSQAAGQEPCT